MRSLSRFCLKPTDSFCPLFLARRVPNASVPLPLGSTHRVHFLKLILSHGLVEHEKGTGSDVIHRQLDHPDPRGTSPGTRPRGVIFEAGHDGDVARWLYPDCLLPLRFHGSEVDQADSVLDPCFDRIRGECSLGPLPRQVHSIPFIDVSFARCFSFFWFRNASAGSERWIRSR